MASRLLLLGCSKRKRCEPGLLPAIDRYDGPPFRVLRRYLRIHSVSDLDIFVLSARYGLVSADQPIADYDLQMSAQRAEELRSGLSVQIAKDLASSPYSEVFICAGRAYRRAFSTCQETLAVVGTVRMATGGQGKQLADLRRWLYAHDPELPLPGYSAGMTGKQHIISLRGRTITTTPTQVLSRARRAIAGRLPQATRCQSWYVLIDGHRVAPKWLVGQIMELPVCAFHSGDARRILRQLGIEVRQA